jgi:anti-anti-sigma factor
VEIQRLNKGSVLMLVLGDEIKGDVASGDVELDIDNNYQVTEVVEEELGKGSKNILLELQNVSYIDSSGLGAIFDSYKQVTEKGGQFKILNPNVDVKRVLDITKISKKINIFDNEEAALSSF